MNNSRYQIRDIVIECRKTLEEIGYRKLYSHTFELLCLTREFPIACGGVKAYIEV